MPDCVLTVLCSAVYFPGHILPHGVLTSDDMDMGQKELALFATFHAVQRWRYTRDLAFAREQHVLQPDPFSSLGLRQCFGNVPAESKC